MKLKNQILTFGTIFWLLAVVGGELILVRYANAPGLPAKAPVHWPGASHIHPISGKSTFVMFAHPFCPCSRASISELSKIMTHAQNRIQAVVIFITPEHHALAKTSLWNQAIQIPGVVVLEDQGNVESKLFGAQTSGQTLLYNEEGRLVFSGGITLARGHEGDNLGEKNVLNLLNYQKGEAQSSVFGCALFNQEKTNVSSSRS